MKEKPRLGRGLDALFDTGAPTTTSDQRMVPIDRIQENPYQPRKSFDSEELSGLSESIKAHGLLQPLVVRPVGDRYQLVAGERRLRAAQSVGFTQVPVCLVNFNDQQVLEAALVENIQRSDLNPIEKAQGFKEYLDRFTMTQEDLAAKLGLDRTTISNLIGLLDLATEVQDAVRLRQISLGHAKVLKGIKDKARQLELCRDIIGKGLSVHATEAMLRQPKPEASNGHAAAPSQPAPEKTAHVQSIEDDLRKQMAVKVEIRLRAEDKGKIVIHFDSGDDFERLVEMLRQ